MTINQVDFIRVIKVESCIQLDIKMIINQLYEKGALFEKLSTSSTLILSFKNDGLSNRFDVLSYGLLVRNFRVDHVSQSERNRKNLIFKWLQIKYSNKNFDA